MPEEYRLLLPFVVAHALTVWVFLQGSQLAVVVAPLLLLGATFLGSLAFSAVLGKGEVARGFPFLGSAALTLPAALWQSRTSHANAILAAIAFVLPMACALVPGSGLQRTARRLGVALLLPGSITVLAASSMSSPRLVDIFEDGHGTLPASEYLRGERPYRDILPGHGLMSDGVIQLAQMKLFGDEYRGLQLGDKVFGAIYWPSIYAVGYAATANPGLAYLCLTTSYVAWPQYSHQRSFPAVWIIALALMASRTGRRGYWIATGVLIPIALCWAVEFAVYGSVAALAALWIARGRRLSHALSVALGMAVSSAAIGLLFGLLGIATEFARSTFVFLPKLIDVYALPLVKPTLPASAAVGELLRYISDRTTFLYLGVAAGLVIVAAAVARAPVIGARGRQAIPPFAFVVAAMLSVIERRHINYPALLLPTALVLALHWLAGRRSELTVRAALALFISVGVLYSWRPLAVIRAAASELRIDKEPTPFATLAYPARARGALFTAADARLVRATNAFLAEAGLSPEETWLDFANVPGLYYLFDRDCPIRYYEVPYYETPSAQAEVIEAIERNPSVRAVLVADGLPSEPMDGVENRLRAPRVAAYIQRAFRPAFRRDGVEFWLRK